MILVQISGFKEAILHKYHPKATNWSAFLLGFSFMTFCSCNTSKTIPVETIKEITKTDTLYINNVQYDSIYINHTSNIDRTHDTIKITETMTEYRYKLLRDTIERIKLEVRHNSIPYEVTSPNSRKSSTSLPGSNPLPS